MRPARMSASLPARAAGPVSLPGPPGWLSCPSFSSSVMRPRNESRKRPIPEVSAGAGAAGGCGSGTGAARRPPQARRDTPPPTTGSRGRCRASTEPTHRDLPTSGFLPGGRRPPPISTIWSRMPTTQASGAWLGVHTHRGPGVLRALGGFNVKHQWVPRPAPDAQLVRPPGLGRTGCARASWVTRRRRRLPPPRTDREGCLPHPPPVRRGSRSRRWRVTPSRSGSSPPCRCPPAPGTHPRPGFLVRPA